MKKKIYTAIALIIILTSMNTAYGIENETIASILIEELTLTDVFKLALEDNVNLNQIERKIKESQEMTRSSKDIKDNIVIGSWTKDYVSALLLKKGYAVESGKYSTMVLNDMKKQTENAIKLQVMSAYYTLLLAEKELEMNKLSYLTAQKHYADAKLGYENGMNTKLELIQAELAVNLAKTEIKNAEDNIEMYILELNNLMNTEFTNKYKLTSELDYVPSGDIILEQGIKSAIENRPEIKHKREEIQLKELALAAKDGYYTSGNWQLRHAKEEVEEAKYLYDKSFREVELDVRKNYLNMIQAEKGYLNICESIEIYKEALRIAELFYENDMMTVAEVNDAQLALKEAEISKNEVLMKYILAREIYLTSLKEGMIEQQ